MRSTSFRLPLSIKFLLYELIGFVLIVLSIGLFEYYTVRDSLYSQVESSTENMLQLLEEILAQEPSLLTTENLQPVTLQVAQRLPNLYRLSIVDHRYRILADSQPERVGQTTEQTALISLLNNGGTTHFYYQTEGDPHYRVSRAIRGPYDAVRQSNIIGAVSLDIALASVNRRLVRDFSQIMLIITALMIFIGFATHALVRRGFVLPLMSLATVVDRFGKGELAARATLATGDELEELAETFNQMAEDLQRKTLFLENIVRSMQDMLIVTTPDGTIQMVNPTAMELLDYPEQELMGQPIDTVLPRTYNPMHPLSSLMPVTRAFETTYLARSGHPIPVSFSGAVMQHNGQLEGIVYVAQDITQRKHAQALLEAAYAELEERVRQRTAELRATNRELQQFTYIVSHDLRVPLVNLKGFAAELRLGLETIQGTLAPLVDRLDAPQARELRLALEEDVPESLGFIESSVSRMDQMVNAILELSRVGHRQLRPIPLDMGALVRDLLHSLAYRIEARGVRVTVGELPTVVADRTMMEQTMSNILSNAVAYLLPDRPGEIEVSGERQADATLFRIQDNGRGIADSDMEKVFAPFRRAGRPDVPGEGMGLAYVQAIIRRHGGHIECHSALGVGTTFTVSLPHHSQGDAQDDD